MPYIVKAASALNVTFARTIAWCLSTMSWAVNTCLGIASDTESTSLLCWPATKRRRREPSTTDVFTVCSLYRCESGWSKRVLDIHFIPFELPIHPTAMVHGVSSSMPTSAQIWCSLIGAERPKTWGGSSQKLGRGSTRGGSSVSRSLSPFTMITISFFYYCRLTVYILV